MASQVLSSVWPLLAVLAFLLVTCVLSVLSHIHKHAIDTHNRIAECMKLRQDFLDGQSSGKRDESAKG